MVFAQAVRRYQGRLSGPLLDRIDMHVEVPALRPSELLAIDDATRGQRESSSVVAQRVAQARERQARRQGVHNALLAAGQMGPELGLGAGARRLLEQVAERLGWSARSLHRVAKVARTVADLAGAPEVAEAHMAEAAQYRRGLPSN